MIVNELLTNAFKYAFPAGRRGEVTVRLSAEGGYYRLCVADDGVGLGAAAGATGATLGLQLVQSLVSQLGGEMSIERQDGTCIAIRFPARGRVRPSVAETAF
jgi:two-component sensor histidine kinase